LKGWRREVALGRIRIRARGSEERADLSVDDIDG